jgi:hypothetical protein
MNILNRDNIDWETLAAQLLWHQVVYHKNEYSGYDIITDYKTLPVWCKDNPEYAYPRGNKPGDIVRDIRFLSYWIGPSRQLTWKELALALDFWKENLLPDYHDCSICSQRKDCKAYFKDNKDQERCSGWMQEHGKPNEEEEYKKFIDNLLNADSPGSISVDLDNIGEEELETILKTLNVSKEELKNMIYKLHV